MSLYYNPTKDWKAASASWNYEKGDFGAPARRGEGFAESEKGGGNPNYVSYEDMWAGKKDFDK